MKLKVWTASALVVLFALAAFAEEKAQKPAMDPAMMEAMMRAGTPGEQHKKLEPFAGSWNTKVTFWMVPGSDPQTMEGTAESKVIFGGRYVEQRFTGSFMGMPFEGIGYTGYDNIKKQYFGTWMDNMSTCIMMSTGKAVDDKTYTFTGMMPDPMTGKDTLVDEKITIVDNDHHTMEMWSPGPDGKMFKTMEMHYTRKK